MPDKERMTMADLKGRRFTKTRGWVEDGDELTSTSELAQEIAQPTKPRGPSLFDLTDTLTGLILRHEQALEDGEDDLAEAIEREFVELGDSFDDKADAYAAVAAEALASADAIKAEEKRLRELRERHERKAERMKQSLYAAMTALGLRSAGKLRPARIQAHGGKVPLVYAEDFDPTTLPPELQRIDKNATAIREALEAGGEVKGVSFGERGESLRWK